MNVWLRALESVLISKWRLLIGRDGGRTEILSEWSGLQAAHLGHQPLQRHEIATRVRPLICFVVRICFIFFLATAVVVALELDECIDLCIHITS